MATRARIVGVHPVKADEPVHLLELLVEGDVQELNIGDVTQEVTGQPRADWQVPYDERLLEQTDKAVRYAFFFHYLDLKRPLLTKHGRLSLPGLTETPAHLRGIDYEPP